MKQGLRRFALGLCAVAALQTAVLVWMIYDRVQLIDTGREIVLEVIPVDPRSLFRGDYVILNYAITRLKPETLAGDGRFERGAPIFVMLKKSEESGWQPVSVWNDMPSGTVADEIVIRGKVQWFARDVRVKYGIESYFVPEGQGKALEKMVRERKLQVLVAVAPDGEAAIKGLMIDGKLRYEEPLL